MFELKIKNSGSAFEQPREEIARILRELADQIENGNNPTIVRDINGNKCGSIVVKKFNN